MKINKNTVKKALFAIALGGSVLGSQSMFNEAQACDGGGECPGPYNKKAEWKWYNSQWNIECPNEGNNCKTCIM